MYVNDSLRLKISTKLKILTRKTDKCSSGLTFLFLANVRTTEKKKIVNKFHIRSYRTHEKSDVVGTQSDSTDRCVARTAFI